MIWTLILWVTFFLGKGAVLGAPLEGFKNVEDVQVEGTN